MTTDVSGRRAMLTFNSLRESDSGMYTCVISHRTMGTLRKNVTLTVLSVPMLEVLPVSTSLPRGANATFECFSNRDATFAWNYRQIDGDLPSGAFVLRNGNSTVSRLRVTNIQEGINTGAYYCHALFSTGEGRIDTGNLVQQCMYQYCTHIYCRYYSVFNLKLKYTLMFSFLFL